MSLESSSVSGRHRIQKSVSVSARNDVRRSTFVISGLLKVLSCRSLRLIQEDFVLTRFVYGRCYVPPEESALSKPIGRPGHDQLGEGGIRSCTFSFILYKLKNA